MGRKIAPLNVVHTCPDPLRVLQKAPRGAFSCIDHLTGKSAEPAFAVGGVGDLKPVGLTPSRLSANRTCSRAGFFLADSRERIAGRLRAQPPRSCSLGTRFREHCRREGRSWKLTSPGRCGWLTLLLFEMAADRVGLTSHPSGPERRTADLPLGDLWPLGTRRRKDGAGKPATMTALVRERRVSLGRDKRACLPGVPARTPVPASLACLA